MNCLMLLHVMLSVLPSKVKAAIQLMLEQADVGFHRVTGRRYYLYERDDGTAFVSLIAPSEWGRPKLTSTFVAGVEALSDQQWRIIIDGA